MKNLSDEDLVLNYCISCMEFDRNTDVPPEGVKKNMLLQKELISRLARGRKAIDAMEKLNNLYMGCTINEGKNRITEAWKIITDYQQSCKEVEG